MQREREKQASISASLFAEQKNESTRDMGLLVEISSSLQAGTKSQKARDAAASLEEAIDKMSRARKSQNAEVLRVAHSTCKAAASAARRVLTAARVAEAQSAPFTTPSQRKKQRNKALYKAVAAATTASSRASQRGAPAMISRKAQKIQKAVGTGVNAVRARKKSAESVARSEIQSTCSSIDSSELSIPAGDKTAGISQTDKQLFKLLEKVMKDKMTQHSRSDNDRIHKVTFCSYQLAL